MATLAERKEYLERLKLWKDEQVIKVVTGIRRCGKSVLLMQIMDELKEHLFRDHGFRLQCSGDMLHGICKDCENRSDQL